MTRTEERFDVVVIGGGPAGATAAEDLARAGRSVMLLDKAGRTKPCGGAIPPRLIRDFGIEDSLLVAKAKSARMVSPKDVAVDMPIDGGFVGMVDRDVFDEWLRKRAADAGAIRVTGKFESVERDAEGSAHVLYREKGNGEVRRAAARLIIGADGARSKVAAAEVPGGDEVKCVFAYHEIVASPEANGAFEPDRCDVYYQGRFSPDFYTWIFPHGECSSIGTGSAHKGFSLRGSIREFREKTGLDGCETIRTEGAPIPMKPLKRWDNGKDVLLVGDAAGVVAPASGEGIYYAMACARMGAATAERFLATGDAKTLKTLRKAFLKDHGQVFWILGMMQHFWYRNDKRRERFVSICADEDVQRLTWDAYMNKALGKPDHAAHMRIFFKDLTHLFGMAPTKKA